MKHPALIAFGCAALVFGLATAPIVSTAAPDPAPTPVPMPHQDFSSMMFLTGNWSCTQMLRGKLRPDTSTTAVSMDGAWLVTQDTAPPFDQYRTYAIHGTTYVGYDSTVKQWIQTGVDSAGGYFTSTSPGWQGSTMVWTTKGLDGSSGTDTFTKVSDTETTDDSTNTDSTGKATKTMVTCKKSS